MITRPEPSPPPASRPDYHFPVLSRPLGWRHGVQGVRWVPVGPSGGAPISVVSRSRASYRKPEKEGAEEARRWLECSVAGNLHAFEDSELLENSKSAILEDWRLRF